MAVYIHYGSESFNPERFEPIRNRDKWSVQTKPDGGFWASPVNAPYGWHDFVIHKMGRPERLETHFCFKLASTAKVLHIHSRDDLEGLPHFRPDYQFPEEFLINFEQLVKDGWDAIELHLYSLKLDGNGDLESSDELQELLCPWDCDSILVMNPDVIEPV